MNAESLISTSVDDAKISLEHQVNNDPIQCLHTVAHAIHILNARGVEKRTLRKALVSAGRKALKILEES